MGLTEAQRKTLSWKAANGSLEVEHLLKVAELGDATDIPFLRILKAEHAWSDDSGEGDHRVVPLGKWTDSICCFLEGGYPGLVQAASESAASAHFSLGVLEELRTAASASAILAIGGPTIYQPEDALEFAIHLATAFNLVLSFKGAPRVASTVEEQIRQFLHRMLATKLSRSQCGTVVCALRGVGDRESVALIESLPPFEDAWEGVEKAAVRQIKKRMRGREDDL